ncbi:alpha/beta-hydrolase, partial [Ascobolus immersus RN42]
PCTDIHLFLARGVASYSNSFLPTLSNSLCTSLPQNITCSYQDIVYPASLDDYCDSVLQGVMAGNQTVTEYAKRCPESQIVLVGHSQGAQVVGDIVAGGGGVVEKLGCKQAGSVGINPGSEVGKQIKAIVLFGDPRHVNSAPYNIGSGSDFNGLFPRTSNSLSLLNSWIPHIRSYCNFGDPYCAFASQIDATDSTQHHNYEDKWMTDAVKFIKSEL